MTVNIKIHNILQVVYNYHPGFFFHCLPSVLPLTVLSIVWHEQWLWCQPSARSPRTQNPPHQAVGPSLFLQSSCFQKPSITRHLRGSLNVVLSPRKRHGHQTNKWASGSLVEEILYLYPRCRLGLARVGHRCESPTLLFCCVSLVYGLCLALLPWD